MCSPDWTESNRHLTVLPDGLNKGRDGDWGIHLTEPHGGGETVIDDAVYWRDELYDESHQLTRSMGATKHASELEDCELYVLDFDELIEVMREHDVITDEGDRDVIHLSKVRSTFPAETVKDKFEHALHEVTIQEAYELGACFVYNKDVRKLAWLYPDGYATETRIRDLFLGARGRMRKQPGIRKGLDLFEQIFED